MIALDEDALICDMAETYQIYDIRRVPAKLLGTLAAGLGADSRIGQKVNGVRGTTSEILTAQLLDALNALIWGLSEDAKHGRNKPVSIASDFYLEYDKDKQKAVDISNFDAAWKQALRNGENNG